MQQKVEISHVPKAIKPQIEGNTDYVSLDSRLLD